MHGEEVPGAGETPCLGCIGGWGEADAVEPLANEVPHTAGCRDDPPHTGPPIGSQLCEWSTTASQNTYCQKSVRTFTSGKIYPLLQIKIMF